jgi:NADPH:quinone reductase-like Zn-dependent oxidoreductase
MKAVVLRGHGGFDRLDYCDVPVPHPGPDDVLVRVSAAALNNTDINTRVGWYSRSVEQSTAHAALGSGAAPENDGGWSGTPFTFPRIQGADVCGRIVAVGSRVASTRVGERVIVDPVLRSPAGMLRDIEYLGADRDGAFAEFVSVPAVNAHAVRCGLTDVELAAVPCAYSAALNMVTRACVRDGEVVLVTGASGGVGSATVQLVRDRGARVIAVCAISKANEIKALGAERMLDRAECVREALGRESVDVVMDVAGGPTFPALLDVLRRGGRYAVAGAIAGPVVALDLRTLYLKDLTLYGCTVTTATLFLELVALLEQGRLHPVVSTTFPLAQMTAAQSLFLEKRHTGKIVLVP